jgi:hypothetical protein
VPVRLPIAFQSLASPVSRQIDGNGVPKPIWQDFEPFPPHLRPLKFEISADDPTTSRFEVLYEGQVYHMHDRRHRITDQGGCSAGSADPSCDHRTLEILTLVIQLLNLNKHQNELPSTGAVQMVN